MSNRIMNPMSYRMMGVTGGNATTTSNNNSNDVVASQDYFNEVILSDVSNHLDEYNTMVSLAMYLATRKRL